MHILMIAGAIRDTYNMVALDKEESQKNEKAPHPWWTATMSLNAEGAIELEKTLSRR